MSTQTFTVSGMTCQHCAMSVTEELTELPGVTNVDVIVATGQVTVTADNEISRGDAHAAITEAGFELNSWPGLG